MGRSQESFQKKEVRKKKEKKRQDKEKRKLARKEEGKTALDDMIAYVDANGMLTSEPPDPKEKETMEASEIEVSVPKMDNSEKNDPIKTGKITFFNQNKGYGFISESMTGMSVFVHVNELEEDVYEGDRVQFEVEKGPKGLNALRVKRL
ncbi:MAG: cold shock domain-containing protein [Bacteroidales bacterium]